MFSQKEKEHLAQVLEDAIIKLDHPEMPKERPVFEIHVKGKEQWSWAIIKPNWFFRENPETPNPWNEVAREFLK